MAYKINSKKEKINKIMGIFVENESRKTKENYLRQTGLFKEQAIKEMSDTQINEMVEVGLKVKGVIKE